MLPVNTTSSIQNQRTTSVVPARQTPQPHSAARRQTPQPGSAAVEEHRRLFSRQSVGYMR